MKCDELKAYNVVVTDECADYICGQEQLSFEAYAAEDVDAYIAGLKCENERLVKCCKEYDSRQRIDERIKFNGAKQLRATKRALWLARAERALTEAEWNRTIENGWKMFRGNYEIAKEYSNSATKWDKVEQLCRKKAEEYK